MVHKNKIWIIAIGFLLFLTNSGMEPNALSNFKKISDEKYVIEQIDANDLSSLLGSSVVWKKNNKDLYLVKLGERIGTTDFYKIYYSEQSGGSCQLSELYRIKA